MTTLFTIYIVCFLAVAVYVGINIFHLIRFRIGFRGDRTSLAIGIYLAIIVAILAVSWLGGVISYQATPQ